MNGVFIRPTNKVAGIVRVPGDKSISHRAALFGGMAHGETHVTNFLLGEDCLSTLRCLRGLGVEWEQRAGEIWIHGRGMENWQEPEDVLDVGNSGTTIRLLTGALAGSPFTSILTGDASIRKRPMRRVTDPLREMGASILGRQGGNMAPLTIAGGNLKGRHFRTPVASAQVKSALMLAGLRARGETIIEEPHLSRDHSERLLRAFGVYVESEGKTVRVHGDAVLQGLPVAVPGDISSAAFFIVLGSLVDSGEIVLPEVGVNPTRTGILEVLRAMGADIDLLEQKEVSGEPRATLRVRPSALKGIEIQGEIIPRLIDELPILAVAACLAEGETVIRDAEELRFKETDRIRTVAEGLQTLGAQIEELSDGLRIKGGRHSLKGGAVRSYGDHRLAMAWSIAGLLSQSGVSVEGVEAASISYPEFIPTLSQLTVL